MQSRPIPILATMAHHGLATIYILTRLPRALPIDSYSSGQLFALAWLVVALVLLFVKPNAGRWVSFALFALVGLGCLGYSAYALSMGVPLQVGLPLYFITLIFLVLAYFLAFGRSTKEYLAALRKNAHGI